MDKFNDFEDLAKKLAESIPDNLKQAGEDIQKTFCSVLQSGFHSMDLVTREQFDTQAAVLARTRQKVDKLEKQVAALEKQWADKPR